MPLPQYIGALAHMLGLPFEAVQGYSNQHNGQAPKSLADLVSWGDTPDWAYGIRRHGADGSWNPVGNGSTNTARSDFDRKVNPQWATVNNSEDYGNQYYDGGPVGAGDQSPEVMKRWADIWNEYQGRGGDEAFFGAGLKPGATQKASLSAPAPAAPSAPPASAGTASQPTTLPVAARTSGAKSGGSDWLGMLADLGGGKSPKGPFPDGALDDKVNGSPYSATGLEELSPTAYGGGKDYFSGATPKNGVAGDAANAKADGQADPNSEGDFDLQTLIQQLLAQYRAQTPRTAGLR